MRASAVASWRPTCAVLPMARSGPLRALEHAMTLVDLDQAVVQRVQDVRVGQLATQQRLHELQAAAALELVGVGDAGLGAGGQRLLL